MAYVIIKVVDTQIDKGVKLEGEDASSVKGADRLEVSVTPGFGSKAVVVIVCENN